MLANEIQEFDNQPLDQINEEQVIKKSITGKNHDLFTLDRLYLNYFCPLSALCCKEMKKYSLLIDTGLG